MSEEHGTHRLFETVGELRGDVRQIDKKIDHLVGAFDSHSKAVNGRIDATNGRLDQHDREITFAKGASVVISFIVGLVPSFVINMFKK